MSGMNGRKRLLLAFLLQGQIFAAEPTQGHDLDVVGVVVVVARRIIVHILDAQPVVAALKILGGDDVADAVFPGSCRTIAVLTIVGDGEFQVAVVLHDLVVVHAVVIRLVVGHITNAGVGGVKVVVDGDAADFIIEIVLDVTTSGLVDGADSDLVGTLRNIRQAEREVKLVDAADEVALIFGPSVTRQHVGDIAFFVVQAASRRALSRVPHSHYNVEPNACNDFYHPVAFTRG